MDGLRPGGRHCLDRPEPGPGPPAGRCRRAGRGDRDRRPLAGPSVLGGQMADPVQSLTFLAWVRERVAEQATAQAQGRASGTATVTLTALGADGTPTGTQSRRVPFLLAGTADVIGLHPGAVVRRYPVPGTVDHESDRCPYVELADASLPWRYTPAPSPGVGSPALHPWLVLVVGEEPELSVADGIATLATSVQTGVQAVGTPSSAYRFAHVQVDG